jgi:hypothetical protein
MSLLTMGSVGIGRDLAHSGDSLARDATVSRTRVVAISSHDVPATGTGAKPSDGVASFGQLLVAQIPSEALLAYTTVLALFTAAESGQDYQAGRWIVYAASLLVCAAAVLGSYFAQRNYQFDDTPPPPSGSAAPVVDDPAQPSTPPPSKLAALHLPILPATSAVLAMAVYGLTVPGSPLQTEISGAAFAIWSGSLAVAGGVMMSILAPFLGKGNGATPAAGAQGHPE